MFLAQRIRNNGKMNSNSKSKEKIKMYHTLYGRNQNKIKKLLFSIGERRLNSLICFMVKSNISYKVKSEIQSIRDNIIESLSDNEIQILANICN